MAQRVDCLCMFGKKKTPLIMYDVTLKLKINCPFQLFLSGSVSTLESANYYDPVTISFADYWDLPV